MRTLLGTFVVSGAGAFLSALLGALTTKVIATVGGPAGIGIFAQLRSIYQCFALLGILNGQTSLVRGIAAREGKDRFQFALAVGVFYLSGIALVGLVAGIFAPLITQASFGRPDEGVTIAIRWMGMGIIFAALASYVIGVLNGLHRTFSLVRAQLLGAAVTALFAYPFSSIGTPLAFLMLLLVGSVATGLAGLWFLRSDFKGAMSAGFAARANLRSVSKEFLATASATAIAGLTGAALVLSLRALYIHSGGLEAGGLFDAAWTLSNMCNVVLLATFSNHYLPALSAAKGSPEIAKAIADTFRFVTLVSATTITAATLLKDLLIELLYTNQFAEARTLLRWLLISEFFKMTNFVLGMPLLARGHNRVFLLSEIAWQGVVLIGALLTFTKSVEFLGMAVLIANVTYGLFMACFVVSTYKLRISLRPLLFWSVGGAAVVVGTLATWESRLTSDFMVILAPIGLLLVMAWLAMGVPERRSLSNWIANLIRR